MENGDQKKKKQHDCAWRKWVEETYTPWYNNRAETTEGDEGGNPGGPPPPPPPVFEDDGE